MIFRIRGLVNRKSTIIFLIVALSFYLLYHFRSNPNAPQVGAKAPDIELTAPDGTKTSLYAMDKPVVLVFFNFHTFLSGGLYSKLYLDRMPFMNALNDTGRAKLVILTDLEQNRNIIEKQFRQSRYKILENRVYLSNIKNTEEAYGISVWPHFFLINKEHTIIYEAKVPNMELVDNILDRS